MSCSRLSGTGSRLACSRRQVAGCVQLPSVGLLLTRVAAAGAGSPAYAADARSLLWAWLLVQCLDDTADYLLPQSWLQVAQQVRRRAELCVQLPQC